MIRLDNTQYTSFNRCQYEWFEKYINKVHLPHIGLRDDALAIGVHFHSVLENGYGGNNFIASNETIEEYPLTHEANLEVRSMAEMYRSQYPSGPVEFNWVKLEAPIEMEVSNYDKDSKIFTYAMVAKVDGYFNVPISTTISGGMGGDIHLESGYYGFETKTKGPSLDRGMYMKEWQAAMQPSFQLLTLEHELAKIGETVRGVLVNVIERPKIYTPRKTCKGCKNLQPMYVYTIENTGQFRCNNCNFLNEFKPPFPEPRVDPPLTWRFLIERSNDRLMVDKASITNVAKKMDEITNGNIGGLWANRSNCADAYRKRTCEYFEPHNSSSPISALEWPGFEIFNPTKYLENKNEVIE